MFGFESINDAFVFVKPASAFLAIGLTSIFLVFVISLLSYVYITDTDIEDNEKLQIITLCRCPDGFLVVISSLVWTFTIAFIGLVFPYIVVIVLWFWVVPAVILIFYGLLKLARTCIRTKKKLDQHINNNLHKKD